ncbi:hypothetical protein DFS34DRAFT_616663 [Phlyctochytrium arcticum]|nr:hypothetical protein DFS34DRAFT_616663 [Phlyctochytrium arcticum]
MLLPTLFAPFLNQPTEKLPKINSHGKKRRRSTSPGNVEHLSDSTPCSARTYASLKAARAAESFARVDGCENVDPELPHRKRRNCTLTNEELSIAFDPDSVWEPVHTIATNTSVSTGYLDPSERHSAPPIHWDASITQVDVAREAAQSTLQSIAPPDNRDSPDQYRTEFSKAPLEPATPIAHTQKDPVPVLSPIRISLRSNSVNTWRDPPASIPETTEQKNIDQEESFDSNNQSHAYTHINTYLHQIHDLRINQHAKVDRIPALASEPDPEPGHCPDYAEINDLLKRLHLERRGG